MAKVASTTCHHSERERERDWMVDSGLVSVDKPLATQQGKRRHHSSHAAITQASTNNHHTITLAIQAWSWSLTACSLTLTHTRGPRQDKEDTTTKPMVWMACTVTMVWHKRGCGVVLPSSLVQHVVAPTPSKWPRAHHTALQPPQHPCFLVSTHVPQPVHTHPHVCVCDCGTEPSTMPTSVVINHCAPCQSTTWSFIHHQSPPPAAAAQEQESVVTQMDEGMEAHTTHSVVESNTANQHTSTHTSGHTNTSQPPIHHPHTQGGWQRA